MSRPSPRTSAAPELDGSRQEAPWRRLDRRTIWVAPLQPLLSMLGVGVLVVTLRGWEKLGFWEPAIGVGVAVVLFVGYAWHWATTRYRVTATHVELHSGMLVRKHRAVVRDRVRTVDLTADVFHRLFGLTVVRIGTGRHGGDADDELKLEAVSAAEAERLRILLLRRETEPADEAARPGGTGSLATLDPRWVRFAPWTLMGLIAVALLVGGGLQLARTLGFEVFSSGPVRGLFDWFERTPLVVAVAAIAGVVLVLSTVLSVLLYFVLYWNFELSRETDRTLRVSYGLLTRRSVSIEERRLRGVRVDEPMLLRWGGGARCKALATGLAKKSDDDEKFALDADLLLPQAPAQEAHRVAGEVLGVRPAPTAAALRRHPAAALRRLVLRATLPAAVPAVVLGALTELGWTPNWSWQVALALIPLGACYGLSEYRNLGHTLTERYLVVRYGSAMRTTVAVDRDGIIGWRIRRTIFQRSAGLLTVSAVVAVGGGEYAARNVDQSDGLALAEAAVPGLLTPFLERP